jgi:NADP-dependent 3-hydroxy acid dehydrogenase YdfG
MGRLEGKVAVITGAASGMGAGSRARLGSYCLERIVSFYRRMPEFERYRRGGR